MIKTIERVKQMVAYAQKATDELKTGEIISECNDMMLVYNLRDI